MGNDKLMIVLDGAMGTELERRGCLAGLPLWSANALLIAPEVVQQIHADYLRAGAQVLTANTFRVNTRTLVRAGLHARMGELTHLAVDLARQAIHETGIPARVAGSMAPVEDCYSPHLVPHDKAALYAEHSELAQHLADARCELLLIETMNTVREATAAARAAGATGLPVWVSFMLNSTYDLLSGESLLDAVRAVLPFHPQALLLNCLPVAQAESAVQLLRRVTPPEIAVGVYANAGHVDGGNWTVARRVSPEDYAQAARAWQRCGATIIGGCCGTTPDHIRRLEI